MSSTPQFTTEQLSAARAQAWHQTGEPLLTLEAVRDWLQSAGLLLFAPRPQHVAAPAPSLVEATLGAATEAPTAAQTDTARALVARLVSEGNALPLNLLGGPGDMPDFVVSAQMFSFVFTLIGDKLWKQAPATSGSVKVTPLALGTYELLAARGAMTASELATELGREITEAAVLRALNELWTHLRVIPLLQQGEAATMWELTSRRFTKAIKAGVNAGQPTALSALVSLYLSQALLGTEEEIAAFLSPLAARSRIREVVHGLTAGRQLEPVVLEGKALLHVPGTLPEFPVIEAPAAEDGTEPTEAGEQEGTAEQGSDEGRIKRFTRSNDRPSPGDFKGKPARSFGSGARGARPSTPRFGERPERTDRERRPFRRDAAASTDKPSFTRPWDENRKPRPAAEGEESAAPKRPYERTARPAAGGYAKREGFTRRPASGGSREGSSDRGPARKSFGDKPPFRKDRGEGFSAKPRFPKDGERKPFVRRDGAGPGESEARPRRNFAEGEGARPRFDRGASKPGGFAPKRPYVRRDSEGGGERPAYGGSNSKPREVAPKRPYVRRDAGDAAGGFSRPSRPSFGGADRKPGGFGAKRPYVRRDGEAGDRPARPSFGERRPAGGDRPSFGGRSGSGDRPSFGGRPAGKSFGDRGPARPFRSAEGGSRGPSARPGGSGFSSRGDGPPRGKFGSKPAGGGFSKRPGGKVPFGGKPGFGQRPAGGTRPAPRKPKPESEE